jgi:hypothetical protein
MPTLLRHLALVADDNVEGQLPLSDLTTVAAALQKQVARDFGPTWGIAATVDAFATLEEVPLGYWHILVGHEGQNGGGVHLTKDNQPYALVDLSPDWTVVASHETVEMLADPWGNRLVAGDSPNPERPGRVEFLLEVCDPCEAPTLGYTVNGVRVSDFYTPRYFEPSQPTEGAAGAQYDFMGHIKAPRQVLPGGYLSWQEADGVWWQELYFGSQVEFKRLGKFDGTQGSLREWIDLTSLQFRREALRQRAEYPNQVLVRLPGEHADDNNRASEASVARAARLREDISRMREAYGS